MIVSLRRAQKPPDQDSVVPRATPRQHCVDVAAATFPKVHRGGTPQRPLRAAAKP